MRKSISIASNCSACNIESDLQTADVNLRTAKIQLLALLNDRSPIEQFDVAGTFDFSDSFCRSKTIAKKRSTRAPTCAPPFEALDKAQTETQAGRSPTAQPIRH